MYDGHYFLLWIFNFFNTTHANEKNIICIKYVLNCYCFDVWKPFLSLTPVQKLMLTAKLSKCECSRIDLERHDGYFCWFPVCSSRVWREWSWCFDLIDVRSVCLSLRTLLTFTVPPSTGRSWTDLSNIDHTNLYCLPAWGHERAINEAVNPQTQTSCSFYHDSASAAQFTLESFSFRNCSELTFWSMKAIVFCK